ncbi:hypothetical protein EMCG_03840 [[Emmonsia] crescens]|uniref:Chromo domain-containing protein n=1 Tax=[Emmonsia] crescens TaxID=73230 RepID=A0A0G2HV62_9EURO|nr:hypothetical protein EMCG_03840 [Emmonsia crescens UAMH 3008]
MGRTRKPTTSTTAHIVSSRKSRNTLSTEESTTTGSESPVQLSDEVSVNSDLEFPIKSILDESRDKYLIAWEGPYEPTWEPKHFANDVAIQTWENKKKRTESVANKPGDADQQSSLYSASTNSAAGPPSTVPETQQAGFSQNSVLSTAAVGSQLSSDPSQGSSASGSLYCPETSDQATQSSGGASTQSQHQILTRGALQVCSRQSIHNPSISAQIEQNSTSRSVQSSSHCSLQFIRPNSRSELLNRLRPLAPRYKLPASHNSLSSSSSADPSQTTSISNISPGSIRFQGTHGYRTRREADSALGYAKSNSNNSGTTIEIAETPPALLSLYHSQSTSQSHPSLSHSTLSRTSIHHSPSQTSVLDDHLVYETPVHPVGIPLNSTVRTVPESVQQDISTQSSKPAIKKKTHSLSRNSNSISVSTSSQLSLKSKASQAANIPRRSIINMNESSPTSGTPNPPMTMEEARRNNPGTNFREKMRFIRAHEHSLIREPQSASASVTPSSAGDIEPSQPAPARDGVSPLNIRVDKEPHTHPPHVMATAETPSPFIAPHALHYNVENPVTVAELLAESQPNLAGEAELPEASAEPIDEPVTAAALEPTAPSFEEGSEPQPVGIKLGPMEFAVPLSMDARVKDDYDITLSAESRTIRKFLGESSSLETDMGSSGLEYDTHILRIRKMINRLNNITTHPDLNDQPAAAGANPAKEAAWAEYSSSKFQFLGYLIDAALDDDLHIIIVARTDKAVKIVENYLIGKEFTYTQQATDKSGDVELSLSKGQLSFAIRSATDNRILQPYKTPAAIISLDNSFDAENPAIRQIRTKWSTNGKLLPVIRLLVSNTSEHVERSLPEASEINRLRLLVKYTRDFSSTAGELQDDALGVQENAEEVVLYLKMDPATRYWPLAVVELIPVETPGGTPPGLEADELRSMLSSRQKRLLENDEDEADNQIKRQRMTPFQDRTHISDSMKGQTQTQDEGDSHLSEQSLVQAKNAMEFEVSQLQTALEKMKTNLQTTEKSFSQLQHRYETRLNNYHKLRQELDEALEASQKSSERLERQKIEISRLKDEKAALTKELDEARTTIKEGGGTDAELEKAREEVRRLIKENASLQRTVQQERSQTEYTRQQYQNASTAAAQTAMELRQLEEELGEMKAKAAGDLTKLKQLRLQNDEQTHLARIKELEMTLAQRNEMLNRKEEELRELKKNRPSTRATSLQPRSPKWGASRPASPGPNNVPGGNLRGSALRFPC